MHLDPPLPIDSALPALRDALRARTAAVLQAPPGAGKTTRVPLALLEEGWLGGAKIVMLEPRRLAARAAAHRMARTLGDEVGGTVGYRVRLDTRVSRRTRIEVVTEGVLTRMIQEDPSLDGVGLLIFDEFHERSLNADLGLALSLQSQSLLRDDLRLLVMSATLDGAPVATLLGEPALRSGQPAPIVTSEGRAFPVEVRWAQRAPAGRIEESVAAAVVEAALREPGDLLVFLPGVREIRRVESLLGDRALPPGTRVFPLHGTMPQELQDAAIRPSEPSERKVVLATSIAETSLTIEGVRVVVDSGLARVPRFSARTGMSRLETVRVSRAAAEQRRGRAGRVAPGTCVRLWSEAEHAGLVPFMRPEILEADLAPLALELASAGITDAGELRWLDPPPAPALAQARELLRELEAVGDDGRITPHGRRMAQLAVHPRLAHMLVIARDEGTGATACDLAALLAERDVLRGDRAAPDADVRLRLDLLRGAREPDYVRGWTVDRDALRRARAESGQLRRALGVAAGEASRDEDAGELLALAYPDRVGQRRPGGAARFLLRNGRGAAFSEPQALSESPWLVAAELDDARPESRVFLAAPLDEETVRARFGAQLESDDVVEWDASARTVSARRRERLGAIVLRDVAVREPDPALVARAVIDAVRREGLGILPWTDASRRLRERLRFLHRLAPHDWPDVGDEALLGRLDDWLAPLLGQGARGGLDRVDMTDALLGGLTWRARQALDELAPTHVMVPSGSRIPVDYADPESPVLAVRLQELFGLAETPAVGGGRVPLTLHLLSPAHRPVQVTRDLAGFWRTSYFDVRKDLRGRYPKHHWPENPMDAAPTNRAKRRGE